jgi:hypothetical protein
MGLVLGCGLGMIHVLVLRAQTQMNMIPVDVCVKGALIAAWKTWKEKLESQPIVPVYNAASIKFVSYASMKENWEYGYEFPSKQSIGIPDVTFTTCTYYAGILRIFRHLIPALLLDGLMILNNMKPK